MKNYLKTMIGAAALSMGIPAIQAMPAYPGVIMAEQPDGTEVEIRLHGDEHYNWTTTPDGSYTLVRDNEGYLTFGRLEGKRLRAGELRYTGAASIRRATASGVVPGLRPERKDAAKAPSSSSLQISGTFPSKGKQKLLLLLINYANTTPLYSQADFDRMMNEENYNGTGSFRDFYLEDSYGNLEINTTVTRWVTLSKNKADYGAEGAKDMIVEALQILDPEIDLRDFDNDGDGVLDGLAVIHQGTGQEASSNPNEIWSHSDIITGKTFDGVQLRRYTIEPEQQYDRYSSIYPISTIGVVCHEFGHQLGAPDFYDVDYGTYGEFPATGVWDLMASGGWNGNSGDRPAHTNLWQKIQLGWVEPTLLTAETSVSDMPDAARNAVAYRFDTTVDGEYFLMENRQQTGNFDVALPSHGLIVYHVNDNMIASAVNTNTLNNKFPQSMYIVSAGADTDPAGMESADPTVYGSVNSSVAPFPGSRGKTSFNDTSVPSTRSIREGRYSYKGLANIAESADGKISFDFITYDIPVSPLNLRAAATRGDVTVSWDAPTDPAPLSYNLYKNGEPVGNLTATTYKDTDISGLTQIKYSVDAVYDNGLVSPAVEVRLNLPAVFITDLAASTDGAEVSVDWNLDTRLTRMHESEEDFVEADYYSDVVEYAHRYRAQDLAIYKGYKIRRIGFLSMMSQKDATLTVTVYEADPVTGEKTVASQRILKEFSNLQWYAATLTKSVEITGEKDIWIAVRVASNTGAVAIMTDGGTTIQGYGNLYRRNDGEWLVDEQLPGNFYLYAQLTEPTVTSVVQAPALGEVEDYLADTAIPQAFAVYRDGQLVGTVGGRKFIDNNVPKGTHTYAVTNLYKGGNESTEKTVEVTVDFDGVSDVAAKVETEIKAIEGGIELAGLRSTATVADLSGRIVARIASDGFIALPAGVYVVTCPEAHKIIVR